MSFRASPGHDRSATCDNQQSHFEAPKLEPRMSATLLFYLSVLVTLSVAVVLIMGLSTLMRGDNTTLSQRLMRWRVGLQFIAVAIIMLFVYLTRGFA